MPVHEPGITPDGAGQCRESDTLRLALLEAEGRDEERVEIDQRDRRDGRGEVELKRKACADLQKRLGGHQSGRGRRIGNIERLAGALDRAGEDQRVEGAGKVCYSLTAGLVEGQRSTARLDAAGADHEPDQEPT